MSASLWGTRMSGPTTSEHDTNLIALPDTTGGTIRCVTTGYGHDAHEALAYAVREAKNGDPLAPVTVVVPSHYAGIAAARALSAENVIGPMQSGRQRGIAAIDFTTTHDLAEKLGGPRMSATRRRPVSNTVIVGAVRAVLRNDPGHFATVATHPTTERSLAEAHRELSEVNAKGLDVLAAQSARSAEVVRVHRAVTGVLKHRFSNEQQLTDEAVAALGDNPETAERLGPVVVFLPQRLTRSQIQLLRAVASVTATTIIAGLTGHPEADSAVEASLYRLGVSTNRRNTSRETQNAPTGVAALQRILSGCRVQALSVSDADDEVRHAVRAVIAATRRGTRLGRCAILYGASQPYTRIVVDALDAAEVRRCGATVHTAGTSWLGRSLLGLLALRGDGFTRNDMMAWLDTAHLRVTLAHNQRRQSMPAPVAEWERIARAARLESGIGEWEHRLEMHIRSCRLKTESLESDDEQEWAARRSRQEAERAEDLLAFTRRLHSHLHPKPVPRTWRALTKWCRGLVRDYLGGHQRNGWPTDEGQLAARVDAAIDRLGDLDGIDDEPSHERFLRALETELDDGANRPVGPFGAGVLVGSPSLALGVELDFAVVCGLAEGVFPSRRRGGSLLTDGERRSIGDDMLSAVDSTGDDHRHFLAVMSAARQVLLTYPRGDLRQNADNPPSRWLMDVAEAKDPDGIRPKGADLAHASDWLSEEPSFVAGLRRTDFPASQQEYDMRSLLDQREQRGAQHPWMETSTSPEPDHPLSADSDTQLLHNAAADHRPELKRGIEMRLARRSARLTRFDGNLCTDGDLRGTELPNPLGPESLISASRLEAWARCPHAYFVKHLLGVDTINDNRDHYRISPLDLGGLVHRILERWLREVIETGETPQPWQPWPEEWQRRLIEIGEEECDQLEASGLSGRKLYWRSDRRRVFADLHNFIDFDNEMRNLHRSTPAAAELGFGLPNSLHGPTSIRLTPNPEETTIPPAPEPEDGWLLRVKGSIDRIDTTATGGLVVVDYKTGSDYRYRRLHTDEPTPDGGHLQLVLYALAARGIFTESRITPAENSHNATTQHSTESPHAQMSVRPNSRCSENDLGEYWFVTSKGGFISKGYRVESARDQVLSTVAGIVAGIQNGVFPMRPPEPGHRAWVSCHFCDPDGLGTRAANHDWKRKHEDPILSWYMNLISTS